QLARHDPEPQRARCRALATVHVDTTQPRRRRDVLVETIRAAAQRAMERARTNLDDRRRRNLDRSLARTARRQCRQQLSIPVHVSEDTVRRRTGHLRDQAGTCDAPWPFMGYVSRHKRRDLSKYETLYEDPDYDRVRAFGAARREEKLTTGVFAGGSTLETLGGLVAVILSILGFSRSPIAMGAVATIALGVALLAQGASIMARWRQALQRAKGTRLDRTELVEGVSTEVFGGAVGIVLGVLTLVGIEPTVMLPVAAIVFGGSLLLGGATQPDL